MNSVDIITTILAPAVMISSTGLFLLGMNNRYSVVVGRIRSMEDEKRKLSLKKMYEPLCETELTRLNSILNQIDKLFYRIKLIRNAVIAYNISVGFFVVTCLIIGLITITGISYSSVFIYIPFFGGLLSVLTGVFYATIEIFKGYEIVKIEVSGDI